MHRFRSLVVGIVLTVLVQLALQAQNINSEYAQSQGSPDRASGAVLHSMVDSSKSSTTLRQNADDDSSFGEDPDNRLMVPFVKHLASDQRTFWTVPIHFRTNDLKWIAPFAGISAGLIASDSWTSKQIPLGRIERSKTISNYGLYSLIAAGGGAFVLGHLTGDDHMVEAGLLSGEAAMNSTAITYLLKSATQRPRPYQTDGTGTFFQGGSSFPSEHAAIAWSIASVMAHEYPGTLSKVLAYGLATGISATRVTSQQHFASDVVIGSALGWYFGRQVYRAHHDVHLGGAPWGDLLPESVGSKERNPENMGSSYVPLDSWIYPALERLIALGYIKTGYLGIRPWTRMECARMLEEGAQNIADQDDPSTAATRLYRDLHQELSAETARLNGAANLGATLDSLYVRTTNISGPPLRDGYHFGQTITNDYGRPYGEGISSVAGISASGVAGPFAFYVRGEYQQAPAMTAFTPGQLQAIAGADLLPAGTNFSVNTASFERFQLLEGSVSLNFKNVQFSFGRQTAWLGPSKTGPFLYSNNAAPITMFKMDTTTPFEFPLLSKLLGPARIEFFLGRLSGHEWINSPTQQNPNQPHLYGPYPSDQPFIHGNKVSFKPTENLEFGAGVTAIFAGAGVPFTFSEFLRTYYAHTALANNPGKRFSAFDFTYRVPRLRKWLTLYMDSLVVDEYSPITSSRASVSPGLYMPQVPRLERLQLRVEGIREPLTREFAPGFVYIDGRYLSGYTNQELLMGNWIGRAGWGGQGWATYTFSTRSSLQFSYRAQRVSPRFVEGGSLNDFSVNWNQTFGHQLTVTTMMQYENWRFPLLQSVRQNNFTSSIQLTYWPHKGPK
jgi:membrane-associated phospholipid phosphatase